MSSKRIGPTPVLRHTALDKALAGYAQSVVTAFVGNASYPNAAAQAAETQKSINELVEMETGPKGSATPGQIRAKRLKVLQNLRKLKEHAQGVIETQTSVADAIAMIESVQMRVRLYTKPFKADFAVKNGSVLGDVVLTARAARGRATYYWQYSLDGVVWLDLPETLQASTTCSGLTAAQTYHFRYRTLTRNGHGDFSQVVSLRIA